MNEVDDLHRYELSVELREEIFRTRIAPTLDVPAQKEPLLVIVGGQPGAGKSRQAETVMHVLGMRGGAAHIDGDLFKPHHPEYARLRLHDDRTAGAYTRLDTRAWCAMAEDRAQTRRVDVVLDSAMASPESMASTTERFRTASYQVHVLAIATPAAVSTLSMADRYAEMRARHGFGRFVSRANHDACYTDMLETATRIDSDRNVNAVFARRRDDVTLYMNDRLPNGSWRNEPGLARAVDAERSRPWTRQESLAFAVQLNRVAHALKQVTPESSRPQWQEDLRHVADLARPLAVAGTPLEAAAAGQLAPAGFNAARLTDPAYPRRFVLENSNTGQNKVPETDPLAHRQITRPIRGPEGR